VKPGGEMMGAIRTIIMADVVMSLNDVIAIAGAAEQADPGHRIPLVIFGLLVSIPLIVWCSRIMLKLLDRFPVIVPPGAALLGWIAGGLIVNDPAGNPWPLRDSPLAIYGMQVTGAICVILTGFILKRRRQHANRIEGGVPPRAL